MKSYRLLVTSILPGAMNALTLGSRIWALLFLDQILTSCPLLTSVYTDVCFRPLYSRICLDPAPAIICTNPYLIPDPISAMTLATMSSALLLTYRWTKGIHPVLMLNISDIEAFLLEEHSK